MSDSYLDRLPSAEREKIRKRLRSPEEYERLREKVKGPEDLEREMEHNAEFAEARLTLETEPKHQEQAKDAVKEWVRDGGIERSLEGGSEAVKQAILSGHFDVITDEKHGVPNLSVRLRQSADKKSSVDAPSGNVSEVFSLKPALQQQILAQFSLKK